MFFLSNVIHNPPNGACCPICGRNCWQSIQWQLPFRYSIGCFVIMIADGVSLTFLAYVASVSTFGQETVNAYLFTLSGDICAFVVMVLCFFVSYFLIKFFIITKYWSDFKKIVLQRCSNCSSTYLFVFDSKNTFIQEKEEFHGV